MGKMATDRTLQGKTLITGAWREIGLAIAKHAAESI